MKYNFSLLFAVVPASIGGYLQLPENISTVEKNPISLVCEASGIPLPTITWLKDGLPITLNGSVRILSGTKAGGQMATSHFVMPRNKLH